MVDMRGGADDGIDPVHPRVGKMNPVQTPPSSHVVQDAHAVAHMPGIWLHDGSAHLENVMCDVDLVAPHEQEHARGDQGWCWLGPAARRW